MPTTPPLVDALRTLATGTPLRTDQAHAAIAEIIAGDTPDVLIAAFLTAIKVRGETGSELAGAVAAVRDRMLRLDRGPTRPDRVVLDTCGTGGDGAHTVNISTATAIVVAACGIPVAKHGNRAASGNSGSAEVLAELGVAIEAEPAVLARCLDDLGITFLFAPKFHPALRFAAPIRRQLPFRTLFNLLGPLVNPADPTHQLIGVPNPTSARLMAEAIAASGTIRRAAIVTGADGLDEVTLGGSTDVLWVRSGFIETEQWTPDQFGLPHVAAESLRIIDPADSARRIRGLLDGEPGSVRDTVLANAAAALLVAEQVSDLRAGVEQAARAIDDGAAARLLDRWGRLTHEDDQAGVGQISS